MDAKRVIKRYHTNTGEISKIERSDINQLVDKIVKIPEEKLYAFGMTLSKREIYALCQYAPLNYLKVEIAKIYDILMYRMDQKAFLYLYQQWTRNYKNRECNEFLLELLALKPMFAQAVQKYGISLGLFLEWIDSENIAAAVGKSCLNILGEELSLEQQLGRFGIYGESLLHRDCQYYFYTYCSREEYLKADQEELKKVVNRYKQNDLKDLKQFLVHFVRVMEMEQLEKYLGVCNELAKITGEPDSKQFSVFFRDVPSQIIAKYKVWLNILNVNEVFGNDERSIFWKEYALYGIYKFYRYSGAFVMEFHEIKIVEFKGKANGPAYFYEKSYFDKNLQYKVQHEKNGDLRQILLHHTDFLERETHIPGWQATFHGLLHQYHIGDYGRRVYGFRTRKIPEISSSHPELAAVPVSDSRYRLLKEKDKIIKADLQSKIIVNAGPGTGKTYTVIERLAYLAKKGEVDLSEILVLCYSRNAVQVIRKRLENKIACGEVGEETRQLFEGIRTFDSFATYMLCDEESNPVEGKDYDERIQYFIQELKKDKDALSGVRYIIIDEMQDLVGARARMVQQILESTNCGFLLLGDKCQSIYDYLIQEEEEIESKKFYHWLETTYDRSAMFYELTENVRQVEELKVKTDRMRQAILRDDKKLQLTCIKELSDEKEPLFDLMKSSQEDYSGNEGILCRNNGEAAVISSYLFEQGIPHQIAGEARHISLQSWYAGILSGYTAKKIGRQQFIQMADEAGIEQAEEKWNALKQLEDEETANVLNLQKVRLAITRGMELPKELVITKEHLPYVSTIHRAKGQEFQKVCLLQQDFVEENFMKEDQLEDEIKVAYVAFTRAKEQIQMCDMRKFYGKKMRSGRWIGYFFAKKHKIYCTNIAVSAQDIDPMGFVDGETKRMQNTIGALTIGEKVTLELIQDCYWIVYQGKIIGKMKDEFSKEVRSAMYATNCSKNLPVSLENVYISNIVTIVQKTVNESVMDPVRSSKIWLGFELSGFAATKWGKEQ